jgi:hypothetical protein
VQTNLHLERLIEAYMLALLLDTNCVPFMPTTGEHLVGLKDMWREDLVSLAGKLTILVT